MLFADVAVRHPVKVVPADSSAISAAHQCAARLAPMPGATLSHRRSMLADVRLITLSALETGRFHRREVVSIVLWR
ncbi:hypothetical protein QQA43_31350 (plasmid) [Mycolicibacterium vanbaalenii]|uniref:hypothetical protein n=1 Tax=Mycolicibacterium vanbaalenii TaxID=110539 RepID=UPI0028778AEE|nr:hypothetical protein [Mycolicibacterium vanbaalenii]WND60370.1 hypothetical protein QQA43_31350 [Mycolicibacterium vanbaalenii]